MRHGDELAKAQRRGGAAGTGGADTADSGSAAVSDFDLSQTMCRAAPLRSSTAPVCARGASMWERRAVQIKLNVTRSDGAYTIDAEMRLGVL